MSLWWSGQGTRLTSCKDGGAPNYPLNTQVLSESFFRSFLGGEDPSLVCHKWSVCLFVSKATTPLTREVENAYEWCAIMAFRKRSDICNWFPGLDGHVKTKSDASCECSRQIKASARVWAWMGFVREPVYRRLSPKSIITVDFLSWLWPNKIWRGLSDSTSFITPRLERKALIILSRGY